MLRHLAVVLLVAAFVSSQPTQANPGTFSVGSLYSLSWWIDSPNSRIQITMSAQVSDSGWVAFGLARNAGLMLDAMVTVGWKSGASYVISARHASNGENEPVQDTVQEATLVSGSYANGMLSITFTRPLTSGVSALDNIPTGSTSVLWAYRGTPNPGATSGGTLFQHDNRGSTSLNLFANPPSTSPSVTASASPGQTPTATRSPTVSGSRTFCSTLNYCITWVLDESNNKMTITMTAPNSQGWVAVGFTSNAGMMFPATSYIGWVSGGTAILSTRTNSGHIEPAPASDQTAAVVSGSVADGKTSITFTRSITKATRAAFDSVTNTDMNVIFASNAGSAPGANAAASLGQHDQRDAAAINFFTGAASSTAVTDVLPTRKAHGSLMFIAWIILVPFGIIVARYCKSWGRPWFILHVFLQTLALAMTIASFGIIVNITPTGEHFAGAHQAHKVIGLIVFIISILQFILGIVANAMWKPQRTAPPIFPDKTHWFLGALVALLAMINVFLGLDAYVSTHVGVWAGLGALVGLILIFFIILQCKCGQTHHGQGTKTAPADVGASAEGPPAAAKKDPSYYSSELSDGGKGA